MNWENLKRTPEIVPGPCDPATGCPPPTEIVCIKTDLVYESCRHTQVNEIEVDLRKTDLSPSGSEAGLPPPPPPLPPITDVTCVSASVVGDPVCEILPGKRAKVSFCYTFTIRYTDALGTHLYKPSTPLCKEVIVRMERAGEPGLKLQCEILVECLDAFLVNERKVKVCIGKMVVFKLYAHVQLLIPSYGFCPEPEECSTSQCPPWVPPWPPYPPPTP